ncbi:SGNH/GDSL hydrolase family protein [Ammonicoccus fulvus]|uniref:SGNH/GDSL hydrolase family protein n=1 Tax=Ammonicoccus fulvus TaxID=3138240 RepID=A0ABZ3FNG5_9ACTN
MGLLCLALVAGCGQAPSEATAPPTPTAAATAPAPSPADTPSGSLTAPDEPTRPTGRAGVPVRKIVGLGDSVMGGTGCECEGPVDALATRLEQRPGAERIARVNLGTDGATTADVGDVIESEDWQPDLKDADVIVIIVGANDLTEAYDAWSEDPENTEPVDDALAQLETSLPDLLARVKTAHGAKPATYLVAGYWNVFAEASVEDVPEGYAGWSRQVTERANTVIETSATDAGMTYVDLVTPFRGPSGDGDPTPFLADDGDHPNEAGVGVIADALVAKVP